MTVMTIVMLLSWAVLTLIALGVLLCFGRRKDDHGGENRVDLAFAPRRCPLRCSLIYRSATLPEVWAFFRAAARRAASACAFCSVLVTSGSMPAFTHAYHRAALARASDKSSQGNARVYGVLWKRNPGYRNCSTHIRFPRGVTLTPRPYLSRVPDNVALGLFV